MNKYVSGTKGSKPKYVNLFLAIVLVFLLILLLVVFNNFETGRQNQGVTGNIISSSNNSLNSGIRASRVDNASANITYGWNHMPITFSMNLSEYQNLSPEDAELIRNNIIYATQEVHAAVPSITFQQLPDGDTNADIMFIWGENPGMLNYSTLQSFDEGATYLAYEGNFFRNVTIYLAYNQNGECPQPILELHELLHAFGIGDSNNLTDIMYYMVSCTNKTMQAPEINYLKSIYG